MNRPYRITPRASQDIETVQEPGRPIPAPKNRLLIA
jgi:hypothetical protein